MVDNSEGLDQQGLSEQSLFSGRFFFFFFFFFFWGGGGAGGAGGGYNTTYIPYWVM